MLACIGSDVLGPGQQAASYADPPNWHIESPYQNDEDYCPFADVHAYAEEGLWAMAITFCAQQGGEDSFAPARSSYSYLTDDEAL